MSVKLWTPEGRCAADAPMRKPLLLKRAGIRYGDVFLHDILVPGSGSSYTFIIILLINNPMVIYSSESFDSVFATCTQFFASQSFTRLFSAISFRSSSGAASFSAFASA